MDLIDLVQDRYRWHAHVKAVMNLQVPQNAGNFVASWRPVRFSRRTLLYGMADIKHVPEKKKKKKNIGARIVKIPK